MLNLFTKTFSGRSMNCLPSSTIKLSPLLDIARHSTAIGMLNPRATAPPSPNQSPVRVCVLASTRCSRKHFNEWFRPHRPANADQREPLTCNGHGRWPGAHFAHTQSKLENRATKPLTQINEQNIRGRATGHRARGTCKFWRAKKKFYLRACAREAGFPARVRRDVIFQVKPLKNELPQGKKLENFTYFQWAATICFPMYKLIMKSPWQFEEQKMLFNWLKNQNFARK